MIPRLHIFEFEDLGYLPRSLRSVVTDVLRFYQERFKIYDPVVPVLAQLLRDQQIQSVMDLCSGSGGSIQRMQRLLQESYGLDIDVLMSDRFPNQRILQKVAQLRNPKLRYQSLPLDIVQDTVHRSGCRTLFTAFHHFKPQQAQRIIHNAVVANDPIAIFEFTERSWRGLGAMLVGPPLLFILAPWIRPFRWSRLFWTYIIPAAPFVLFWDGIVSCLRTYSDEELLAFTTRYPEYRWTTGKVWSGLNRVSYLVGRPR